MYRYRITFTPELKKSRELQDLRHSVEDVQEAARIFSEAGARAKVKKSIAEESIEVGEGHITFVLTSSVWLEHPTKAAKFFVQQLAKKERYIPLINSSGRLFRGSWELLENLHPLQEQEQRELSDEEVLLAVTKLFFRETPENRERINQIKSVMKEE